MPTLCSLPVKGLQRVSDPGTRRRDASQSPSAECRMFDYLCSAIPHSGISPHPRPMVGWHAVTRDCLASHMLFPETRRGVGEHSYDDGCCCDSTLAHRHSPLDCLARAVTCHHGAITTWGGAAADTSSAAPPDVVSAFPLPRSLLSLLSLYPGLIGALASSSAAPGLSARDCPIAVRPGAGDGSRPAS
ncbi:hypothetical protein VTN96DRAFT_8570 [Rasamsonia emersonii]